MKKMMFVGILLVLCSVLLADINITGTGVLPKSNLYDGASGGLIEISNLIGNNLSAGVSFGYTSWDLDRFQQSTGCHFWEQINTNHGRFDDYGLGLFLSDSSKFAPGWRVDTKAGVKYHIVNSNATMEEFHPPWCVTYIHNLDTDNYYSADFGLDFSYMLMNGFSVLFGGGYQWDLSRNWVTVDGENWKKNDFGGWTGKFGFKVEF
jgi:hypothetical protein